MVKDDKRVKHGHHFEVEMAPLQIKIVTILIAINSIGRKNHLI